MTKHYRGWYNTAPQLVYKAQKGVYTSEEWAAMGITPYRGFTASWKPMPEAERKAIQDARYKRHQFKIGERVIHTTSTRFNSIEYGYIVAVDRVGNFGDASNPLYSVKYDNGMIALNVEGYKLQSLAVVPVVQVVSIVKVDRKLAA